MPHLIVETSTAVCPVLMVGIPKSNGPSQSESVKPSGGTYHGREAVKQYLMQSRAAWAEGSSEPEQFIVAGDRIVVFVYARFRPKDSNDMADAGKVAGGQIYSVHEGRIVQMNAFAATVNKAPAFLGRPTRSRNACHLNTTTTKRKTESR